MSGYYAVALHGSASRTPLANAIHGTIRQPGYRLVIPFKQMHPQYPGLESRPDMRVAAMNSYTADAPLMVALPSTASPW